MTGSLLNVIAALFNALIGAAHAAETADPTRPAAWQAEVPAIEVSAAPTQWRLSLVKVSSGHRSAVLNGTSVSEGDLIGPATVIAIRPTGVVLDTGGEEVHVPLAEPLGQRSQGTVAAESKWKEARWAQ